MLCFLVVVAVFNLWYKIFFFYHIFQTGFESWSCCLSLQNANVAVIIITMSSFPWDIIYFCISFFFFETGSLIQAGLKHLMYGRMTLNSGPSVFTSWAMRLHIYIYIYHLVYELCSAGMEPRFWSMLNKHFINWVTSAQMLLSLGESPWKIFSCDCFSLSTVTNHLRKGY